MAHDTARGVSVLFGGCYNDANFHNLGDTWEWNGSTWTLRASSGPSPRDYHAMAYDVGRSVRVLFGGQNAGNDYGDVGMECQRMDAALQQRSIPAPRARHGL